MGKQKNTPRVTTPTGHSTISANTLDEIVENVTGFFRILQEWDAAGRRRGMSDSGEAAP